MIKNIAVITSLFDYPNHYLPTFYGKATKYFNQSDIHILRNNSKTDQSYYDKLFYFKIPTVLEYIKKTILSNYEFVLFLDATDTDFYSDPHNIVNIFKKKNCSILMGAEKGLWPNTKYSHLYKEKKVDGPYNFLNSGTYIGYTDSIVHHMEKIINSNYEVGIDDQGQWSIEYLLSTDILIDNDCEIFMSTYNSKNEIDSNFKIKSYNPIIIHDNGPHNDETLKLVGKI